MESTDFRSKLRKTSTDRWMLNLNHGSYLDFPSEVLELAEVEELYICHGQITRIPEQIHDLTQLKVIDLKDNEFIEFPSALCYLPLVERIDLSHNEIIRLPEKLSRLKQLKSLVLTNNNLKGTLDNNVYGLESLEDLNISMNKINDIPASIGQLSNLKKLDISRNEFIKPPLVLEELTQLSKLDISYNKLEDFSINLHRLQNLENVDFEGNMLTKVPLTVCKLTKLKRLDIAKNLIGCLPDGFGDSLVDCLEELWMEHNVFVGFPEEVCSLTNLTTLSLNGNQLNIIPKSICKLSNLKNLDVGNCSLSEIPHSITMLTKLQWLCINDNRITELPRRILQLKELSFIYVNGNPLRSPPMAVCQRGVKAIFNFINEANIEPTFHQKLILIGNVKAGKTSLTRTLMEDLSQLTSDEERTIVLDQKSWNLKRNLHLQVYDFGGNSWYEIVRPFFIDRHAIVLLVINLVKYEDKEYNENVGKWLQFLQARAPGSKIFIVGTHTDMCSTEEIKYKKSSILEIMNAKERLVVTKVQEQLSKLQASDHHTDLLVKRLKASLNSRLILPNDREVYAVSSKTLENIADLKTAICLETRARGRIIPASWQQLLHHIQSSSMSTDKRFLTLEDILTIDRTMHLNTDDSSLSKGEDICSLRRQQQQSNNNNATSDETSDKVTAIPTHDSYDDRLTHDLPASIDDSVEEARDATRKLSRTILTATERLDEILSFFHSIGDILWYEENPDIKQFVFHKQSFLISLLKSIFSERLKPQLDMQQVIGRAFVKQGFSIQSLQAAKHELFKRGIMSLQLLKGILDHLQLKDDIIEAVVKLLIQFDLCFQVPGSVIPRLQFPWLLCTSEPREATALLRHPPDGMEERFVLEYVFPVTCPASLYETISVRVHRVFRDVEGIQHWRDGLLARIRTCKVLLHRSTEPSYISLIVQGAEVAEMWRLVTRLQEEMLSIMDSWPGVVREAWLVCPHCTKAGLDGSVSWRFPGEIMETECPDDEEFVSCPNTDQLIPISLVHPITASRDTPTTNELQEIASELCTKWKDLGRVLGLKESVLMQVDCKEADPQEKVYQMLLCWTQSRGFKATRASLANALSSKYVDREDLAESVSGRIRRHGNKRMIYS